MKTLIVIPVRMASRRFPNKPMNLIKGKPMIQRVWEQAESSGATGDGSDGLSSGQGTALGLDFGIIGGLRDKYWVGGYLSNINSPMIGPQYLPRKLSTSSLS